MADDTGTDWAATATEIEGFSCTNWGCDHHECRHLRVAAAGLRRYADVWLFEVKVAAVANPVNKHAVLLLTDLTRAIRQQDYEHCAICGDVYCSGANCLQSMVAELPDDHQEERIEEVQDLVRLGRILSDWLVKTKEAADAAAVAEGAEDRGQTDG